MDPNVIHRLRQKLRAYVNKNVTSAEIILQECVTLWNNQKSRRYIMSYSMIECCEIALENRFLPMLKLLLSQDGISNYLDANDKRLMKTAIRSDFVEGVQFIHSKGGRLDKDCINECVENNKHEVLKYILEHKDLDTNKTLLPSGLEPNIKGTNCKQIDTINQQLKPPEISALHCCIRGRNFVQKKPEKVLKCVKLLVEAGADLNLEDNDGKTPVQLAAVYGMVTTVLYLAQKGAHLGKNTLLHYLAQSKRASDSYDECLQLLIKEGMNINKPNSQNITPLYQAVQYNNVDMVKSLLNIKSTRHSCDRCGDKPLALAAKNNNIQLVTLLASKDGDINHQNLQGQTALHKAIATIAVKKKNEGIETNSYTSDNSIPVFKIRKSARFYINERTIRSITEILLKFGADVNLSDNNGRTALMEAARACTRSGLQCLVDAGAAVNLSDNNGRTALMEVARACNRSGLECLLEAGADVNLSDNDGRTALIVAAKNRDRHILGSLLKAGADVNKTDINGRSAIHDVMCGPLWGRSAMNTVLLDTHELDTHVRSALHRVYDAYLENCIYCLKLLLIRKFHVSLDTPVNGLTLFTCLLDTDKADLIWHLVTENCSITGMNLPRVINKLQFTDTLKLSKILFESGAPKREIETVLMRSFSNSQSPYNPVLDDFRNFWKSRSLQSRCRREIRNYIGSGIRSKITQIGLPQCLQDYVIMKDLIPEKYFTLVINDDDDDDKYVTVDDNKDDDDDVRLDGGEEEEDNRGDDDVRLDDNKEGEDNRGDDDVRLGDNKEEEEEDDDDDDFDHYEDKNHFTFAYPICDESDDIGDKEEVDDEEGGDDEEGDDEEDGDDDDDYDDEDDDYSDDSKGENHETFDRFIFDDGDADDELGKDDNEDGDYKDREYSNDSQGDNYETVVRFKFDDLEDLYHSIFNNGTYQKALDILKALPKFTPRFDDDSSDEYWQDKYRQDDDTTLPNIWPWFDDDVPDVDDDSLDELDLFL
ncbi:uncharacterized protein LOC126810372 [Patella vulgata]|uniref:uncharacterized protein LOC126810372 n=1 Tax=Patella vulgata TaxID=6465 RepID=UPI0024A8A2F6|nr:uncharacterized protein LOC126810372 [Patella vulgata]